MNWNKIASLLHIVEKTNPNERPTLKPIHDAAMAELTAEIEASKPEAEKPKALLPRDPQPRAVPADEALRRPVPQPRVGHSEEGRE